MTNVTLDPIAPSAQSNSAWFFSDPERVTLLRNEADEWYRPYTPFRRNSHAKGAGGGTDCVGFDEAVLKAAGAIPWDIYFPRSRRDYSPHVMNDRILKCLRGQADDPQSATLATIFAELPADSIKSYTDVLPGDICIMKSGVGLYHMPIVIDPPRCMQCAYPDGVSELDLFDPQYNEKLITVFRARALTG
jgi:hypothetical protein